MRPRRLLIFAVATTLLCVGLWVQRHALAPPQPAGGSSPVSSGRPVAVAPVAAPPLTLRWDVGQRRTYTLYSERRIRFRKSASRPADPSSSRENPADDTFRIALSGIWQVAVVRVDGFGVLVETALVEPRVELGAEAEGSEPSTRLRALLATPFFLQLSPSGQLRALRLPAGHSPFSRGVLKALAASLQYVRPGLSDSEKVSPSATGASVWQCRELDATGEYEARYERRSDGLACEKTRLRYTQVAAAQGLMPVTQLGRVSGELRVHYDLSPGDDEAARVVGLAGQETLDVDPGPGLPQVSSHSQFSLRFVQATALADASARAARASAPDFEVVALGQADVDPDSERRSDLQTVRGAHFADLLRSLDALSKSDDGAARAELLSRLSALLRLEPQAAQQVQEAIVAGAAEATTRTLLGALGAAGSGPAQTALVTLAESATLSADVRSNAVAMLGLGDHPSDATTVALSKLAGDRDVDVRSTAALALGNAALAQRKDGQVGESAQAVDELLAKLAAATTQDEQLLYLQALGNAGDGRALPALQAALSAGDDEVRSAAVTALRFIDSDSVDALIASALLRDAAEKVRRSAVFAASFRSLLLLLPSLRQAALGDPAAGVRGDIVGVLGRSLSVPGVLELLQTLAARDEAPAVRQAAAAALGRR